MTRTCLNVTWCSAAAIILGRVGVLSAARIFWVWKQVYGACLLLFGIERRTCPLSVACLTPKAATNYSPDPRPPPAAARRPKPSSFGRHGKRNPTQQVERMNELPPSIMPYYCTEVIRQCIKKGLTEKPQSWGANAVARGIDIPVSQLSVQFADMAR